MGGGFGGRPAALDSLGVRAGGRPGVEGFNRKCRIGLIASSSQDLEGWMEDGGRA